MDDFATLFQGPGSATQTSTNVADATPDQPMPSAAMSSRRMSQPPKTTLPTRSKTIALPSLDAMPRPELLMKGCTPYHIVVEAQKDRILVMGSHEPSLDLLHSYLKKWVRNDQHSVANVCENFFLPPCNTDALSMSPSYCPIIGRALAEQCRHLV